MAKSKIGDYKGDPRPKKSKDYVSHLLNPKNWGLTNYTSEDSFNEAFRLARKNGEKEFIYNGKRYNTQSNESPDVQYKKFGNVNQILEYGPRDKQNLTDIINYYRKAHNDTTVNGGKRGRGKFEADLLDLHKEQGNPGVYFDRNGGKSYYRPFTNNMTLENEEDYLDELAHAKQSNNPFKDGYEYLQEKISGKSRYSREGTTENEAHSVIKPKLYKKLGLSGFNNHYRDSVVNAGLIKRGLYLDKQLEQDYSDTITYDPDGKPVDWTKVKKHSDGIYAMGGTYSNRKLKKFAWGDYYDNPDNRRFMGGMMNSLGQGINNTGELTNTSANNARKESEAQASGLIEGISAANPIVGGFMKIGQGIGSQTINEDGTYKSRTGEFIDNNINPTTGIQNLKDFAKNPTWETGLNQFTGGLLGESASQKRVKADNLEANRRVINNLRKDSQYALGNYPSYGYAKYGMKYPMGGRLPYPTDGSKYNTLASNMVQYHGDNHENGGISLDTDQDNSPDIEIEDNEVIKDDMVYSDRLTPSQEAIGLAGKVGIKLTNKDTYASATSKIGKVKGTFEKKLNSLRPIERRTGELMVNRLDNTANLLFEDQQSQKADATRVAPNPKPELDKPIGKDATNDYFIRRALGFDNYKNENVYPYTLANGGKLPSLGKYKVGDREFDIQPEGEISSTAGYFYPEKDRQLVSDTNLPALGDFSISDRIDTMTVPNMEQSSQSNNGGPTLRRSSWGDYQGDIAAGIGTMVNQALINKLETDFNPDLVANPRYTYTDRLPSLTKNAESQFRTASAGINGSSAQDNNALKANLYAKTLDSINQAMDSEFQRKDIFDSRYNELVSRTNSINTELKNRAKLVGMENRNQRLALTQANIDNAIRSTMGNQTMREAQELDFIKSYLQHAKEGDTGVSRRLIAQLPERARRRIGFQ